MHLIGTSRRPVVWKGARGILPAVLDCSSACQASPTRESTAPPQGWSEVGGHPEQLLKPSQGPKTTGLLPQAAKVNQVSKNCHLQELFIVEHKQNQELPLGIFQRNGKKKHLTKATHENIASKKQEAYQANILICTSHFFFANHYTFI